jgi:hypothetical protein
MSFIGFACAVNYKDLWTERDFNAQLSFKLPAIQAVFDLKQPLDNLSPAEQNVALIQVCKALKSALKRTSSR